MKGTLWRNRDIQRMVIRNLHFNEHRPMALIYLVNRHFDFLESKQVEWWPVRIIHRSISLER